MHASSWEHKRCHKITAVIKCTQKNKIEEPLSCLSCAFPEGDVRAKRKKGKDKMLAIFTFLFLVSHLFTSYPVWMVSNKNYFFLLWLQTLFFTKHRINKQWARSFKYIYVSFQCLSGTEIHRSYFETQHRSEGRRVIVFYILSDVSNDAICYFIPIEVYFGLFKITVSKHQKGPPLIGLVDNILKKNSNMAKTSLKVWATFEGVLWARHLAAMKTFHVATSWVLVLEKLFLFPCLKRTWRKATTMVKVKEALKSLGLHSEEKDEGGEYSEV